jgi:hypothetical protein
MKPGFVEFKRLKTWSADILDEKQERSSTAGAADDSP